MIYCVTTLVSCDINGSKMSERTPASTRHLDCCVNIPVEQYTEVCDVCARVTRTMSNVICIVRGVSPRLSTTCGIHRVSERCCHSDYTRGSCDCHGCRRRPGTLPVSLMVSQRLPNYFRLLGMTWGQITPCAHDVATGSTAAMESSCSGFAHICSVMLTSGCGSGSGMMQDA